MKQQTADKPPGAADCVYACRHPAVLAAFAAVAKHRRGIEGSVKISAYEEQHLPSSSAARGASGQQAGPGPGSCNLLAFPAGLRFEGLSFEQIGLAVALATADDPKQLQMRGTERKALNARMVSCCAASSAGHPHAFQQPAVCCCSSPSPHCHC